MPALESRARALSRELRCMVCQNQSIDDSDAPLARDLRMLVRERLTAGDSDGQVIDFLVVRYGEFVLLKPRIAWHTAILWGAPLAILRSASFVARVRAAAPRRAARFGCRPPPDADSAGSRNAASTAWSSDSAAGRCTGSAPRSRRSSGLDSTSS